MRFYGFGTRRNVNQRAVDQHPIATFDDATHSGDAGKDGFEVLAKANPRFAGERPFVEGTEGLVSRGPDQSFEQ